MLPTKPIGILYFGMSLSQPRFSTFQSCGAEEPTGPVRLAQRITLRTRPQELHLTSGSRIVSQYPSQ